MVTWVVLLKASVKELREKCASYMREREEQFLPFAMDHITGEPCSHGEWDGRGPKWDGRGPKWDGHDMVYLLTVSAADLCRDV